MHGKLGGCWACASESPLAPNPRLQRTPSAPLSRQPLGRRKGLWSALVAASFACSRPNLEARIASLVGPDATDCGHVSVNGDRAASSSCLVKAFSSGRPFWVRYDRRGIDSHVETAFVRSREGRFLRLEYDSDARGGGSLLPRPRLTEHPCTGHISEASDRLPEFVCE